MSERESGCVFWDIAADRAPAQAILRNDVAMSILDVHPLARGRGPSSPYEVKAMGLPAALDELTTGSSVRIVPRLKPTHRRRQRVGVHLDDRPPRGGGSRSVRCVAPPACGIPPAMASALGLARGRHSRQHAITSARNPESEGDQGARTQRTG